MWESAEDMTEEAAGRGDRTYSSLKTYLNSETRMSKSSQVDRNELRLKKEKRKASQGLSENASAKRNEATSRNLKKKTRANTDTWVDERKTGE